MLTTLARTYAPRIGRSMLIESVIGCSPRFLPPTVGGCYVALQLTRGGHGVSLASFPPPGHRSCLGSRHPVVQLRTAVAKFPSHYCHSCLLGASNCVTCATHTHWRRRHAHFQHDRRRSQASVDSHCWRRDRWARRCHLPPTEWPPSFCLTPCRFNFSTQTDTHIQVLDQAGLDSDSGAAIHLCPNASGILHQWNIDAKAFGACLMSRYVERTMDGKTLKDIDLTEANARWPHPWHLVHRASLHKELKRVATSEERPGTPVKLFPHHRVVKVDHERGVTLDNGTVMEADVILGADGIFVGHKCNSDSVLTAAVC